MRGTLLFVHSSQVYMEELNDDSSFINRRSTTEPPGTEPKILSIHHASLSSHSLIVLSTRSADYSVFQGRSGLFVCPVLTSGQSSALLFRGGREKYRFWKQSPGVEPGRMVKTKTVQLKKKKVKGEGVKQKGERQSECVKNMCVYDGGKSER